MKCPSCNNKAITFFEWLQGIKAFKTECDYCSVDLKANFVVYFLFITSLLLAGLWLVFLDDIFLYFEFETTIKKIKLLTAIPIIFMGGFIAWLFGGYKLSGNVVVNDADEPPVPWSEVERTIEKYKKTEALTSSFDETYSQQILKVARNSPAGLIGLKEGDYIVGINGHHASDIDLNEYYARATAIDYQFYSSEDNQYISISLDSVPLGVITEPSTKGIVNRYTQGSFYGWSDFEILWKRRSWDALYTASVAVSNDDLIDRFIRLFKNNYNISAEVLFKGAALFELDEPEDGIDLISIFINKHMHQHELSNRAIAFYYAAKWAELVENKEDYEYWLEKANQCNGGKFDRISQEVAIKNGGELSVRYHWLNKTFPYLYKCNDINSNEVISLEETLENMKDDELLPICAMPSYRGNGPYDYAMSVYRSIYSYLSDKLKPMHVLTDVLEKRKDREWWWNNENQAIAAGVPFHILYNEEREIFDVLDNDSTPVFYFINNKGLVLYEGKLVEDYYYWDTLIR